MKEDERIEKLGAKSSIIYIVDDDEDFLDEVVAGLSRLGWYVRGFPNATTLYRAWASKAADILILDVGLDGEDGLSIATHLRSSQSIGLVMVTARGAIEDRAAGLRAGADAYLVKPVSVRELAAILEALNDRLSSLGNLAPRKALEWALVEGGWVLVDGMGHRLRLTTAEQRILGRLFVERGATVARAALVQALEEDIYDFNYSHIDTIISRLRRRAKKANMTLPLHAIRGEGFTFTD